MNDSRRSPSEIPHEPSVSGAPPRGWPRSPWFKGTLVAEFIWGLAWFGFYAFDTFGASFPRWFEELDLADTLGSICAVVAAPVSIGGWLLVWGDKGPPFAWIENTAFNFVFGLCFYGVLGAAAGVLCAQLKRRRRDQIERL